MRPVFAVPITLGLKEMPCVEPTLQGMRVLKTGSRVGVGWGTQRSKLVAASLCLSANALAASPGRTLLWLLGRRLLPAIITPAAL